MEFELEARPPEDDAAWRRSLAALALLLIIIVVAQLWTAAIRPGSSKKQSGVNSQALITGDFYIRLDQAYPSAKATATAVRFYEQALPWPSAYRRLGVMKESYGKSGLEDFLKLDSRGATRGMSKKEIAKLSREKTMWLEIFAQEKLTPIKARGYIKQIEPLNLGPLKHAAIALVYERSGQHSEYERVRAESKAEATAFMGRWILLLGVLMIGGTAGLIGAFLFLTKTATRFAAAPRLPLQSSVLMSAFVVYLASFLLLSGLADALADAVGAAASGAAFMALVILSGLAAGGLGMMTLVSRSRMIGQDWRQIGLRTSDAGRDIMTGIYGFFSSLPFVFAAAIIAQVLNKTVFRYFQTPEQPFQKIVSGGGIAEIALVIFAAAVMAPVIEETFFRGVLYSAFRGRMAAWPSVLITSAIFAVVHPLPGGFLPIFALACTLAVLREQSGSLLPCIVCHGIYNTVVLIVAALMS